MAAETALTASPPAADVPRRTWRQWWRQLPGYWRIAAWTIGLTVAIHVYAAARITLGLIESRDVRTFRRPGVTLAYRSESYQYPWAPHPSCEPIIRLIVDGWRGRTGSEISVISLNSTATAADLEHISRGFPNLVRLSINGAELSSADLISLRTSAELRSLALCDVRLNDDDVWELSALEQLETLDLRGSDVTDACLPVFAGMPHLCVVNLNNTRVTPAGLMEFQWTQPEPYPRILSDFDRPAGSIRGTIVWADGTRTTSVTQSLILEVTGRVEDRRTRKITGSPGSEQLLWSSLEITDLSPGEYVLQLVMGGIKSAPIRVTVTPEGMEPDVLEFQMPMNRPADLR